MRKIGQILVCVLIGALLCLNIFQGVRWNNAVRKGDILSADTLKVYDTVRVEVPAPKDEKPLGSIAVKLPVSASKTQQSKPKITKPIKIEQDSVGNFSNSITSTPDDKEDNFPNKSEHKSEHKSGLKDEQKPDSVVVEVPITQKKYEGDGYTAYISGYKQSLDSLNFNRTTNIVYKEPSRWSVGIQVGVGVTRDMKFSPYVGVGVSYRLFDIKKREQRRHNRLTNKAQ